MKKNGTEKKRYFALYKEILIYLRKKVPERKKNFIFNKYIVNYLNKLYSVILFLHRTAGRHGIFASNCTSAIARRQKEQ
jgi:hypothetical protein